MKTLRALLVLSLALPVIACSGPGSPSGPLDAGSLPEAGDSGGGSDVVTPIFDAPVVGPLDAFALDEAGKSSTCAALSAYAKCNGATDPCAAIDLKDCVAFDGMYNLAGRQAISTCYGSSACGEEAGTVSQCVYGAATMVTPGAAQKTLATHFCGACAADAGASCETAFYDAVANDAGVVGLGVLLQLAIISDDTLAQIDSQCVAAAAQAGTSCSDTFGQCAGSLLVLAPGQCGDTGDGGADAGADADPGGA